MLSVRAAIFIIAAALGLSQSAPLVLADEAFVCGPSTIVYVKSEELDAKKHSDPCIAAHYGIDLKMVTSSVQTALAVTKPAKVVMPAVPAIASVATLQRAPRYKSRTNVITERPAASPGTDYRNVKVINATTPESAWFRHMR